MGVWGVRGPNARGKIVLVIMPDEKQPVQLSFSVDTLNVLAGARAVEASPRAARSDLQLSSVPSVKGRVSMYTTAVSQYYHLR